MTDAIRPALTPEEWAEFGRSPDGWPKLPRYAHADDGPWLMACANHALPDGHPNKFTREDVKLLDSAVGAVEFAHSNYCSVQICPPGCLAEMERLRSLAARIEALLPPE